MAEELDEGLGELVPELPLPVVLKVEDKGLELLGSFISLLGEEIGDGVGAHGGGMCRSWWVVTCGCGW